MKLLSLRASFAGYPIMKRVIELIRVSTEGQAADDRASIPAQRTVNRRTCAQYGLDIVRSIEFSDVSGASVLLAPEMKELLLTIQDPAIDGVVARGVFPVDETGGFRRLRLTASIREHGNRSVLT